MCYSSFLSDFNDDCCSLVSDLMTLMKPQGREEQNHTHQGSIILVSVEYFGECFVISSMILVVSFGLARAETALT